MFADNADALHVAQSDREWRWRAAHFVTHAQKDGKTALMCAAMKGHADCVRLLLDAGAYKEATDGVRVSNRSVLICSYARMIGQAAVSSV